ncbi:MAG: hydrogenase nickel incorporation protein HypB [Actinomycetota bacterium]|nr:hydrogenase nickel incorporation protein HypB [Actinomycetota bacterium]
MKVNVVENVLAYNKEHAEQNRDLFAKNGVFVINILSSPGAGKTTLIIETLKKLENDYAIGVVEGDISSTHDAEKIKRYTDAVVQINTGGSCHLNASMVKKALEKLDLEKLDILFIENVGNLICPVNFDLGENIMAVLSSVNEGDDKPVKYPPVFVKSGLVLLNKIDMLENSDFDLAFFQGKVRKLNPKASLINFSCKTGENLDKWIDWLKTNKDIG